MPMTIRNEEANELAQEISRRTGETKTDAVITALRERLERLKRLRRARSLPERLAEIAERCARLPIVDARTPDAILGYDENGLSR